VSAETRAMFQEVCTDCHFDGADIPSLEKPVLERRFAILALDQVAFAIMPKFPTALDPPARDKLMRSLFADLGFTASHKAVEYYSMAQGPIGVHHLPARQKVIERAAGAASTIKWVAPEWLFRQEQDLLSPSAAAMSGLDALRACQAAGKSGPALLPCIRQAASVEVISDSSIAR
jgi:hypothetical protein